MNKVIFLMVILMAVTLVFGDFSSAILSESENLIEARVSNSNGNFGIGFEDSKSLTEGYRDPSRYSGNALSLFVDGAIYRSFSAPGDPSCYNLDIHFVSSELEHRTNTLISTWQIPQTSGYLEIRQLLTPQIIDGFEMVQIEFEVENFCSAPHNVGVQLALDTKLNREVNPDFTAGYNHVASGTIYNRRALPDYIQAYEENYLSEDTQIISRLILSHDLPDMVGIGDYAYNYSSGIATPCIIDTLEYQPWVDMPIIYAGMFISWTPEAISPSGELTHTTYYGLGAEYAPEPYTVSVSYDGTNTANIEMCEIENTVDASISINSRAIASLTSNVNVTMSFGHGSPLMATETNHLLSPEDIEEEMSIPFYFTIPNNYSTLETKYDTLIFEISGDDLETVVYKEVFTTPLFNHEPPNADLPSTSGTICNEIELVIPVSDSDSDINPYLTRVSLNGTLFDNYDGVFFYRDDALNIPLAPEIATLHGEHIALGNEITVCIEELVDRHGCGIDAPICDTLIFDLDSPEIANITPSPGSQIERCLSEISVELADYSEIIFDDALITINGETYTSTSEIITLTGTNMTITPDIPIHEDTLTICISNIHDNTTCSHTLEETCMTYYSRDITPEIALAGSTLDMINGEFIDELSINILPIREIIYDSLEIHIGDYIYRYDDFYLEYSTGEIITLLDIGPFESGTYDVIITNVHDTYCHIMDDINLGSVEIHNCGEFGIYPDFCTTSPIPFGSTIGYYVTSEDTFVSVDELEILINGHPCPFDIHTSGDEYGYEISIDIPREVVIIESERIEGHVELCINGVSDYWGCEIPTFCHGFVLGSEMIEETTIKPEELALSSYPNPFNSELNITVNVENNAQIALYAVNTHGNRTVIYKGSANSGLNTYHWNAENAQSGTYTIILETKDSIVSKKTTLIK